MEEHAAGEKVLYLGRYVPVKGFRAYIYGINGETKLINSWKEYLEHKATGLWFGQLQDVPVVEKEAPKTKRKEAK